MGWLYPARVMKQNDAKVCVCVYVRVCIYIYICAYLRVQVHRSPSYVYSDTYQHVLQCKALDMICMFQSCCPAPRSGSELIIIT